MPSNVSKGKQRYGYAKYNRVYGKKKGPKKAKVLAPGTQQLIRAIARNATRSALNRQVEMKSYNRTFDWNLTSSQSSHVTDICNMVQGTQIGQRVGNKVTLKAARVIYQWELPATGWTGDYYNTVRVMMFQWKLSGTATVPTFSEITHSATANAFLKSVDVEQRKNVVLLYDKTVRLVAPTAANSTANYRIYNGAHYFRDDIKLDLRYCAKDVRFDSDAESTGDNHIFIVAVSDSTVSPHPQVFFHSEVMYTDM